MTFTSEERREVAARLREAAVDDGHIGRPYGQRGFQVTLRRIIGTSNPNRPALYTRLADLIDPTCHVVGTLSMDWSDGSTVYVHNLSCGHTCETSLPEPPAFCDKCGARVMDDGR